MELAAIVRAPHLLPVAGIKWKHSSKHTLQITALTSVYPDSSTEATKKAWGNKRSGLLLVRFLGRVWACFGSFSFSLAGPVPSLARQSWISITKGTADCSRDSSPKATLVPKYSVVVGSSVHQVIKAL